MNKFTIIRYLFLILFAFANTVCISQNYKPFTVRYDKNIKGSTYVIGNNILNRYDAIDGTEVPFNDPLGNNGFLTMKYIDIDGDPSTFSSSKAELTTPDPATNPCFKIVYVGLYWGAILFRKDDNGNTIDRSNINKVKFKAPFSSGVYTNITGTIIYDDVNTSAVSEDLVYSCYADITNLFDNQTQTSGDYIVADILSSQGTNCINGVCAGFAAGWTLFVVYEDPSMPNKYITSFDGFSTISASVPALDIPITGFKTIPVGEVKVDFAFSAIEGDKTIGGDKLSINGYLMTAIDRPGDNFFNSTITDKTGITTNRTPNSTNTLGFDAGIFKIDNSGSPPVIDNGATSAMITLSSTGDKYYFYFCAVAVDVIRPNISVIKTVQTVAGIDVGDTPVNRFANLKYVIKIKNVGNENVTAFYIKDVIPPNLIVGTVTPPAGITSIYDATKREFVFTVADNLVEVGDAEQIIEIPITVSGNCADFKSACSNIIENTAYSNYRGMVTGVDITDDPSAPDAICGGAAAKPTTFYVTVTDCNYPTTVPMCDVAVNLKATDGFTTYKWAKTVTPNPPTTIISTSQSIDAIEPGIYWVFSNTSNPKCVTLVENFTVTSSLSISGNPLQPSANEMVEECNDTGAKMAVIFLGGTKLTHNITITGVNVTYSITWQKLSDPSCSANTTDNCPKLGACIWSDIGSGTSYTVSTAGNYRLKITNTVDNCSRYFYFNVFLIELSLTLTTGPTCNNNDGVLTATARGGPILPSFGTASPYIYSVVPVPPTPALPAIGQDGDVFTKFPSGTYEVAVQSKADVGAIIFLVKATITIALPVLTVNTTVDNVKCVGTATGKFTALASGSVIGNYSYVLNREGTGTVITNITGLFVNLLVGKYHVEVRSGVCSVLSSPALTITEPTAITETHDITKVNCYGQSTGKLVINSTGGTGVHKYSISPKLTEFQTSNVFDKLSAGKYDVIIVDDNMCQFPFEYTIPESPQFLMSIIEGTVVSEICAGDKTGAVSLNASGGTEPYSISMQGQTINGNSSTIFAFTNISGGSHKVSVTDLLGCNYSQEILLPEAPNFNPTADVKYYCTRIADINIISNYVTINPNQQNTYKSDFVFTLDNNISQSSNLFKDISIKSHNVDVKHNNGCTKSVSFEVVFKELKVTIRQGKGLNELIADVEGVSDKHQYTWNGEYTGEVNTYIYYKTGDYTVEIVDGYGCKFSASTYFEFIDVRVPNAFTPNGDGYNDTWGVLNAENNTDMIIFVFDRNGRQLISLNKGQFWDGTYQGVQLATGDYWYVIKLNNQKDTREFTGAFTLYR